ncbi:MAG: acyltransferase [Phycisphaerales bacterium]|nr:acyltransferase [Phycisphaerales bacterium]
MKNLARFITSHLSRRTSGRQLIPEIDGLRSIAILSVVFFHAAANFAFYANQGTDGTLLDTWLLRMLPTGEYGVPLFFAISGFILAVPFASHHLLGERKPSLKKYFIRRITRLEPPYIFALTIFMLKQVVERVVIAHEAGTLPEILSHFGASCVYLHNAIYHGPSTILVVAWSLEVEVQFYILAPIITRVFAIKSAAARRAILALGMVTLSWFFGVEKPIAGLTILNQGAYFLAGLFLADVYLTHLRDDARRPHWAADLIAIITLAGVFVAKAFDFHPVLLTPWLILAGYIAVFRAGPVRRLFRATPVVILGGMCYTIYLWHFIVIATFRHPFFKILHPEPTWYWRVAYILIASAVAISVSAVLFALIERPTMNPRWPQDLWARVRRLLGRSPAQP